MKGPGFYGDTRELRLSVQIGRARNIPSIDVIHVSDAATDLLNVGRPEEWMVDIHHLLSHRLGFLALDPKNTYTRLLPLMKKEVAERRNEILTPSGTNNGFPEKRLN